MKTPLFSVGFFFSIAVSASAIPLYESFEYDDSVTNALIGKIDTRDSIQWFQAGPNVALTNQPVIRTIGSLNYPGHPPGRGNLVELGGPTNGTSARFSFKNSDVVLTGPLYYSFLMKLTDLLSATNVGIFWCGFNNTQGSQTTTPTVVAPRLITKNDTNNAGSYLIGLDKSSGTAGNFVFSTNSFSTNQVVFVIARYTFIGDTGGGTDYADVWINPDPTNFGAATPPPPTLTSSLGGDQGNFRSFVLLNRSGGTPPASTPRVQIDELLIGDNWADVAPPTNGMLAIPLKNQSVVVGNSVAFESRAQLADSYQWRSNGVDIAGATGNTLLLTNVQLAHAGTYSVVMSNIVGPVTNSATLTVVSGAGLPSLLPLWSVAPGDRGYITVESGSNPAQRGIAYSPASNQVFVVTVTNHLTLASTGEVYVLDATTGADLYQLNTDAGVINSSSFNSGNLPIDNIEIGDDGSVYGGNLTDNGGTRAFKLYRWANSSAGAAPVTVTSTIDPAFSPTQHRWGDTLSVRGTGIGTEVVIDDDTGMYGVIFKPTDETLGSFDSIGNIFFTTNARPSFGRSVQFGPTNSVFQKARSIGYGGAGPLTKRLFTIGVPTTGTTLESSFNVFSSDIGPLALDPEQHLLAALSFSPVSTAPDSVALYEITDLANPILLGRYAFPTNHQSNSDSLGRVVIGKTPALTASVSGANVVLSWPTDRVYALNGNNGIVAFEVTNGVPWTVQSTISLSAPVVWTSIGTGTMSGHKFSFSQIATTSERFYRLTR